MKIKLCMLLVFFFASSLQAKPVYLKCDVSGETSATTFNVKIDEDTGKITHTAHNGSAFNAVGFFSANKISYQNLTISGAIKMTLLYEIDRTNLNASQTFSLEPTDPSLASKETVATSTMSGKCEIEEIATRKI